MRTFLEKLESLATDQPHIPAIEIAGKSISYQQLWHRITLASANACRLGYQPEGTFVFASKPTLKTLPIVLGLVRAGLRIVFLDPFTAIDSFQVRLSLVNPNFVMAESTLYAIGSSKARLARRLMKITIANFGSADSADYFFTGRRLPLLPKGSKPAIKEFLRPISAPIRCERIANSDSIVVFTSGTTADPKGVVHSLESISANFEQTAEIFSFKPGDRVLCEPMTVGLVALTAGATWLLPGKNSSKNFNKFFGVPTDALELLKVIEQDRVLKNRIEYFGMGGAPIPPALVQRVLDVVGSDTRVPCIYGMTEILPVAFCDGREKFLDAKGDFLGKPLEGVEVRLASDFELEVRGSGLMKSYLGRPPHEWHATGDLARLDQHGDIVMLGRKKNMLIRGDTNIYPSLYEPAITTISGVADAVMVGVPNEYGDDRVVLIVIPESGQSVDELRNRIQPQLPIHVDRDALPDALLFLQTMPVSGRGKKRDMAKLVELARGHLQGLQL